MHAVLAAAASPRRREILRLVWHDEQNAGEIARAMPDVTFGAISQHLRGLTDAGLVAVRRDGRQRLYRANQPALGSIGKTLEEMWDDQLWKLKLMAELDAARRGPRPSSKRGRSTRTSRTRKVGRS